MTIETDIKKLRRAMPEALVRSWLAEGNMHSVFHRAFQLAEMECPEDADLYFGMSSQALRAKYIFAKLPCRAWINTNMRQLSEAMWGGRNNEACITIAKRALGLHQNNGALRAPARAGDKSHDWKTVK